jgi:hypothetical protein
MKSTVMPMIKQQLLDLKASAIITVYHRQNVTKTYRSYTVPSTIVANTVAFRQAEQANADGSYCIVMTFTFGEASFGSIDIVDPIFEGLQYFELAARVTISTFNELFIGDLAFLAMLVGMNNSSGAHCLMCMMGRGKFNCPLHQQLVFRTKES